jgi:FtsP/CotA-like multicopper oxidase with cupredoxin domain
VRDRAKIKGVFGKLTFFLFSGLELILLFFLAVTWGATAWGANGLKYAALEQTAVPPWRRATRIGVWTGLILLFLWCFLQMAGLLELGWDFVMDRFAVMFPLLILPALWVGSCTWPALNTHASVKSLVWMVTSIHTMLLGTLLVIWLILFDIPAIPDISEIVAPLAVLAVCAAVLYRYHWRRAMTIQARRQGIRTMARRSAGCALSAVILLAAWNLWSQHASRFPPSMLMVHPKTFEFGGGTELPVVASAGHHFHPGRHHVTTADGSRTVSVTDLTGPRSGIPDKRFTLVAQKQTIDLPSGHTIEAWTFNGRVPGPEMVVREGDLVEVTLINRDIEQGVSIHWHGIDVPNAEDGVPGVTQDAVMPGESHTYRFVVNETGSHWYHSHQLSSVQVAKGLFGAFIILPADGKAAASEMDGKTADITVFSHDWETAEGRTAALHLPEFADGETRNIKPGTEVRLRLVNSANLTKLFTLNGTPFRVAAIDGWDIHQPDEMTGKRLKIGGGGRYDVTFTMTDHPVTLALHGEGSEAEDYLVFGGDGQGTPDTRMGGEVLDPLEYGSPSPAPFGETTVFDREFLMMLDQFYLGYYNGRANSLWTINGEVFPNTPTYVVKEGELVKIRIVNRSLVYHPMHLHGHHVFVLSRNGHPYKGSPLWLDTVLVEPGETYELAFYANNPGIWMDHCHVLEHAAWGMSMHLMYHNVTTPFMAGPATGNHPE